MASNYYKLEIELRNEVGSKVSKGLRREGKLPSVLYFKGEETLHLSIDKLKLNQALNSSQRIYEIELETGTQYVMIKNLQYHPVTDEVIHIDFMRVKRTEKMTIAVPIILVGKSIGVTEGGILSQGLNQIEVSCFPTNVPEQIELDVTKLDLNESFSVSDLKFEDEDIEILSSLDISVASVITQGSAEEEIESAEEESEVEESSRAVENENTKDSNEKS